jgi:hypothetical protein
LRTDLFAGLIRNKQKKKKENRKEKKTPKAPDACIINNQMMNGMNFHTYAH